MVNISYYKRIFTSHVGLCSTNRDKKVFLALVLNDDKFVEVNHSEKNCTSKSNVYKHAIEESSTTKITKSATLNVSRSCIGKPKARKDLTKGRAEYDCDI